MRLLIAFILLGTSSVAAPNPETGTVQVEKLDIGDTQTGQNKFSAVLVNNTDSMVTVVLDLRADPGLWLRKNQRQFVYLLYEKGERHIEAEYQFDHISPEASLRVRLYFPEVDHTGITKLPKPFFEQRFTVGLESKNIDYDLSTKFRKRETAHFSIYYFPGSLAAHDIERIAKERDRGFERIAALLDLQADQKIRLFLFPDEESKRSETGHQGAGWAFSNNIVEVYNETTKLDPYHETAHILTGALGSPAAMFSEGLAVYVSETLGADALRELGSPGRTCDQAVLERQSKTDFIPLRRLLSFKEIGSESTRPSTSYPEACSMVRFLVNRYGLEKFRQAFASVGAGDAAALESVYGSGIDELEQSWLSNASAPDVNRRE